MYITALLGLALVCGCLKESVRVTPLQKAAAEAYYGTNIHHALEVMQAYYVSLTNNVNLPNKAFYYREKGMLAGRISLMYVKINDNKLAMCYMADAIENMDRYVMASNGHSHRGTSNEIVQAICALDRGRRTVLMDADK